MSELVPAKVEEMVSGDLVERENLFKPLVQDARSTLRRVMLNSTDPKMAVKVAETILDRAGEGVRKQDEQGTTIVINESQVNLLVQTQKELLGG